MTGAAGFASGDTAYLSPAGPFREAVTVAMTSATGETFVIGDPANAQGFKDSGGVLVAAGDVIWTAYTTDDVTAPSSTGTITLAGRDYLTFRNLIIIGGTGTNGACVNANTTHSTNITFRDCFFLPGAPSVTLIRYDNVADAAANWIIDRCTFVIGSTAIRIGLATSTTADYDANFLIQNCLIDGGFDAALSINSSGANSFKGGGVDVFNCTFLVRNSCVLAAGTTLSTSIPCTVYNSVLSAPSQTALSSGASGQLVEDYNKISAATPRTNVTAGGNSIATAAYPILLEFNQGALTGRQPRIFGMPTAGSPMLGRGAQAGGPTVDILNRARPAGGGSTSYAWGAYERHDTAVRETSVVDAGSNAIKIVGPGDHDFLIPVDASSTTVTVRARYDTNHATTNKPQATILNGEEIGVATETKTMTAAVDTYETLTFSAISPTAKGFITLRLISRSAAGNGIAYFDTAAY